MSHTFELQAGVPEAQPRARGNGAYLAARNKALAGTGEISAWARRAWSTRRARGQQLALKLCMGQLPLFRLEVRDGR